jgi:hypothetical protein
LDRWIKTLPQPWTAAMEATIFTGWIYDYLNACLDPALMSLGQQLWYAKTPSVLYWA